MSRVAAAVASLLCAIACLGLLAGPAVASSKRQNASLDFRVLAQLNQIRTAHGLAQLELTDRLSAAAHAHTLDMVAKGYFAHDSLGGTPFWKRIEGYYPSGKFSFWSVGENLFWESGAVDATAGVKAWMASPEHRANILSRTWREIGIASVTVPSAPGTFDGLGVTLITTDFGVRR